MIRVKKIAHATYETPDLEQQIEYYTDILGLTLVAMESDTAYLASTIDHHSVMLRRASKRAARGSASRSRPRTTSTPSTSRPRRTGIKTRAQAGPAAHHRRHGHLRGPQGHRDGGVQARRIRAPEIPDQGHRAAQARPRRVLRDRRQAHHRFLLRRARLPRVGLDGRLLLVPALRRRPSHHQSDAGPGRTGTSTPPSSCATGATC